MPRELELRPFYYYIIYILSGRIVSFTVVKTLETFFSTNCWTNANLQISNRKIETNGSFFSGLTLHI